MMLYQRAICEATGKGVTKNSDEEQVISLTPPLEIKNSYVPYRHFVVPKSPREFIAEKSRNATF